MNTVSGCNANCLPACHHGGPTVICILLVGLKYAFPWTRNRRVHLHVPMEASGEIRHLPESVELVLVKVTNARRGAVFLI